jgi:micrococcal nuclease
MNPMFWPRLTLLTTAGALAGLLTACAPPTASVPIPTTTLQVTSVADGDTFTGRDSTGAKVKVRMLSIDAPEESHKGTKAACGARAASTRLRELIAGKTVTLITDSRADDTDQYGRRLVYVELDGKDVALTLLDEGLVGAWYPSGELRPDRFDEYSTAEEAATSSKIGSWATCSNLGR